MQVEILGLNQRVGNGLLGQVTPLEVVGNHKHQGFFPSALKFNVARRYARAFASGGPVASVEYQLLEKHNGIKQTVCANVSSKVLQFVLVRRRHQEADRVRVGSLRRVID